MIMRGERRTGFALVELLVVVTTMAVLMTLAVNLIHGLSLWSSRTEDAAHHALATHRLEEQLRRDLHEATSVTVAGERMTIAMAEATSEWMLEGDACVMTRTAGDEIRRERFELGNGDEWQEEQGNAMVTISIWSIGEPKREVLRITERAPRLEGGSP
ncbi:PulJ/GspJ family protein [Aeoliella sp. SH292]|uniref:PulJ/GspJ family protein n=1 Tax=Aeoliella sp. SH292 TaxID=3454464 RepID=UPI003F992840